MVRSLNYFPFSLSNLQPYLLQVRNYLPFSLSSGEIIELSPLLPLQPNILLKRENQPLPFILLILKMKCLDSDTIVISQRLSSILSILNEIALQREWQYL